MGNNGKRVVIMHESREVTFVTPSGDELGTVYVNVNDGTVTTLEHSVADEFIKDVILPQVYESPEGTNSISVKGLFTSSRELAFKMPSYYSFISYEASSVTNDILNKLEKLGYTVTIKSNTRIAPNSSVDIVISWTPWRTNND